MKLLTPQNRVKFAWFLLFFTLIAWPISAITIFRDEPQGILGLSWLALSLTSLDILSSQDIRKEQDK